VSAPSEWVEVQPTLAGQQKLAAHRGHGVEQGSAVTPASHSTWAAMSPAGPPPTVATSTCKAWDLGNGERFPDQSEGVRCRNFNAPGLAAVRKAMCTACPGYDQGQRQARYSRSWAQSSGRSCGFAEDFEVPAPTRPKYRGAAPSGPSAACRHRGSVKPHWRATSMRCAATPTRPPRLVCLAPCAGLAASALR